jgi:hypothetical protein
MPKQKNKKEVETFNPKDMLKKSKKKEPFLNRKIRERNKELKELEKFQRGK